MDPYKGLIIDRLAAYPELSAVRLLEEVRPAGYTGSYSLLLKYVRQVRPRPAPAPVERFETPAGHQAQIDFAEFTFPWGKRYALLVVLGYSRLLWLRFYQCQDMRTLFRGLEEAFAYFGGVPRELLFDQMKAVISSDLRFLGGQLLVNEEFLRFAAHWGFRPRACRAYRAQTKGKVERPIAYVRDNFVYGRDFASDAHPTRSERGGSIEPTSASTGRRRRSPASASNEMSVGCLRRWRSVPTARSSCRRSVLPGRR